MKARTSSMSYSALPARELTRGTLDRSKDVIFIADSSLRITFHNRAWDQFALANNGESLVGDRVLGTDLMAVIADPLRKFYTEVFQRCRGHSLGFQFDYECSSAELYRQFHMHILPLKSGSLAFINSVRVEHLHGPERPASPPVDDYSGAGGLLTMCCHCRRTQRQGASDIWDWVPSALRKEKSEITYGMCPICMAYFYSGYLNKLSGAA